MFDAIDMSAPAGRYAIDALSPKVFKGRGQDAIRLGRRISVLSAKEAWHWGGFALAAPERHLEARQIADRLQKMVAWCAELEGEELSNALFEFIRVDGEDDPIEKHIQDAEGLLAAAEKFRSAVLDYTDGRDIGAKPSLKNSRPLEREFIKALKENWLGFAYKPLPRSRIGPHVDFAYAAWHDAGFPELDSDDDVLALYMERLA